MWKARFDKVPVGTNKRTVFKKEGSRVELSHIMVDSARVYGVTITGPKRADLLAELLRELGQSVDFQLVKGGYQVVWIAEARPRDVVPLTARLTPRRMRTICESFGLTGQEAQLAIDMFYKSPVYSREQLTVAVVLGRQAPDLESDSLLLANRAYQQLCAEGARTH